MEEIIIYTDGACSMPSMKGGWGVVLQVNGKTQELSGFCANTTNNQMELTACIKGLGCVSANANVKIFTDSTYVKNGITTWILTWKKNGWKTASKQPVKNIELWQQLDTLNQKIAPSWHWVKAHNGNFLNERADFLATSQIKKNW